MLFLAIKVLITIAFLCAFYCGKTALYNDVVNQHKLLWAIFVQYVNKPSLSLALRERSILPLQRK